jgi:lipopolysaccharide export LptBFGC system permease protein LptF
MPWPIALDNSLVYGIKYIMEMFVMDNGFALKSAKGIIKRLSVCFGIAFLFVFVVLMINQLFLIFSEKRLSFSQGTILLAYSLPAVIVMTAPYAVCVGFMYGLIKMNIKEKISWNKKNSIPVFVLGLIISLATLFICEVILPNANSNVIKSFWTFLEIEGDPVKGPREMSSTMILQKINELQDDAKTANIYILEFNKRYSIPFGALFFAFLALSLSIVLKNRLKTALGIGLLSCVLYWAVLMAGQIFSINKEKYGAFIMWLPNILFLFISIILLLVKYKAQSSASVSRR